MFNSLTGRTLIKDRPPDACRHRAARRGPRAVLTLASAVAIGVAMMVAAQPAQAATNLDGPWTVSHGGTGQLTLNADGTYTSTCQLTPGYAGASCPAPKGTFAYGYPSGNNFVGFYGDDGTSITYRVSGYVSHPDELSTVTSRNDSGIVFTRGSDFTCTDWSDNAYRLKSTPLAYVDETSEILYATGSHQLLGPAIADNDVSLAETAPNYFQRGRCDDLYPTLTMASFLHIDNIRDATTAATSSKAKKWSPWATVTIQDLSGVPVSGATVSGTFTGTDAAFTCVTVADGTCTLGNFALPNSVTSTDFRVGSVVKPGSVFLQNPGHDPTAPDARLLTIYNPLVGPPPPPPVTVHVSDLDAGAFATPSPKMWQPQVTVYLTGSDGYTVYGATVTGTFTHHSGTVTCTTDGRGACSLGDFTLNRSTKTTVFTVTGVTAASSTYVPAENSDPDGDSNGTSITVKVSMAG